MKPTLNNDALPITGAINEILIKYASALSEIQRLQKIREQDRTAFDDLRERAHTAHEENARLREEIGMKANPDIINDFSRLQADCQQEADGGVGCSAWLGGNDKQENTSILNLLSLWSSQSERKSLMSSLAQSSRPALSEPDKKSHTWLKRLRGMLLSVLRFGRTSQQTKSLKP